MVSAAIWILAAASLIVAVAHQISSTQPIGEGEVFVEDTEAADEIVAGASSTDRGVRHARNALGIEAVSIVDDTGLVIASTSRTLADRPLSNPLLASGVTNGRFAALADSTDVPLEIDGVVEWPVGSVLYQVLSPRAEGESFVMLHYEISELLARRAHPGEVQPLTFQLLVLGAVFVILGSVVFMGHSRAARRHREMAVESEQLRTQSRALEEANAELAAARRRAEGALALAEEKMRIRSEFVLMINHELRTPLTSVVTGAELIRDHDLNPEERSELIDSMVANGNRLSEIIDQILAVARVENQGLTYDLQEVSLADVCEAAHIDTIDDIDDPTRVSMQTDIGTVALVVGSLTDNARTHGASKVSIRCSAEPGIEAMLELGERPDSAVFLTVTDDGPGIDPEFLPRAFEKFEKNSFSSGTGLGLYMVRLMVEALGGSVGVSTTPGGTTFQIALPVQSSDRVMEAV